MVHSAFESTTAISKATVGPGRSRWSGSKRIMRTATAVLASGLVAAASSAAISAAPAQASSNSGILTIAGDDGGPFPASANPFGSTNGLGQLTPFVYEPLFQFDWLKPTETIPWLATASTWSNGGRVLKLTIRNGVKWSDGQPFSAADVAFTFNMIKTHQAINFNGLQITNVATSGNTVTLTFAKPAYSQFYYIASTYIVPEHIWKSYSNPQTAQNLNPVGTGPYLVSTFSPQSIILKPNPNYWGTKPKVAEIVEPDILSNNTCDSELYTGQAQWGGCFLASFKNFKANKYNVFSSSPEQVQALIPNLTKYPMSNLDFRKAVSDAIDRKAVAIAGDLGEEPWITSPTGLVLPAERAFLASKYAHATYQRNIAEAKALLKAGGFKYSSSGTLEGSNGQPLNVTITVVAAYSDNVASAETILQDFKQIGLQGSLHLEAAPAVTTDEETGNFQFAEGSTAGGLSPYVVYNSYLNDALTAPVGKTASGDFERFHSKAADNYLAQFAGTANLAVQEKAAAGLETIQVDQLPIIPFMYTVAWGEYNTKYFTGWPSPSNPYALGTTYYTPEDELVILHLQPRG
jgi:peptide/nickel transport system substrate-binding protein